jgi:hypothetical protein
MTVKKEFQGTNPHRYKANPLEKAFAEKWQEINTGPMGRVRTTLDYLMDSSNRGEPNPPLTERDWLVANTLIQWLGSPVGQGFIRDVILSNNAKDSHTFLRDLINEAQKTSFGNRE